MPAILIQLHLMTAVITGRLQEHVHYLCQSMYQTSVQLNASSPAQWMSSDRKVTSKQTYYQQHLIWKEDIVPQQVKYFSEEFGDNIRDTCETLVDLFHCLFAKDIIHPLMSLDSLKMVYYSYFHSIMTYGLIFCGNSHHTNIIFRQQKELLDSL